MQAPSIGVLDCDKNKDMKADIFATLKKRMIRKIAQAARCSLHQFRKSRHNGPKCRESLSPMEKITSGDLEGGLQPPAPDLGLQSFF